MFSFIFSFFKKILVYAIAAIAVIAVALYFRGYFSGHISTIENVATTIDQHIQQGVAIVNPPAAPCSQPITYSLGTFDSGFGLTKAQFLADVNQAVQIWNKPFGRTFFILALSSAQSQVKINLIYDYRQQATDAMNVVGVSIDDETTVYSALKAKYAALTTAYASEKASLTSIESSFQTAENSYNQEVDYWNSHGGASASEYTALNQEKATLESQAAQIASDTDAVNADVATINSTAATVNKYVALLNSESTQYNSIASSTGEEFDEGEYVVDATGRRIDIYQYDTQTKLIRVLAHELGHALGLGHSYTNPQAIMYPENQGTALSLAPQDIAAVEQLCGIRE